MEVKIVQNSQNKDLGKIVADNLVVFRKSAKLTQSELAEKLNYSDKAISKWERGESMPDVETMQALADIYRVNVDVLLRSDAVPQSQVKFKSKLSTKNKRLISTLSALVVWVVATVIYVLLNVIPNELVNSWLIFVYAVPVSLFVLIIMSHIWTSYITQGIVTSLYMWTQVLAIYLTFTMQNNWLLFIACVPMQALIILWFIYRRSKQMGK